MTAIAPLSVLLCGVLGLTVASFAILRIFVLERRHARRALDPVRRVPVGSPGSRRPLRAA